MQSKPPSYLFVTCSQGLEDLLIKELESLGFSELKKGFRGVYVPFQDLTSVYKINYSSRLATRVLLPLFRFYCRGKDDLYNQAKKFDWTPFIKLNQTFLIDANVTHRMLKNSLFATQVMKDGIADHFQEKFGKRPSVDLKNPDIHLNLFINETTAIVSFDTSGDPLYKRGYRQEKGIAPLQESLAAAILMLANYDSKEILLDPCAGSGTFLIEAALMATHTPPGYLRKKWAFMDLPKFSMNEWLQVKNEQDSFRKPLSKNHIFGCEINNQMVLYSKLNLKAAGFFKEIEIVKADFREFTPTLPPTLVVTNPPHGIRMNDINPLRSLYRSLGDFLKRKTAKPTSRGFIFTGSLELAKEIGLRASRKYPLVSGGVEGRLLEFDVYDEEK